MLADETRLFLCCWERAPNNFCFLCISLHSPILAKPYSVHLHSDAQRKAQPSLSLKRKVRPLFVAFCVLKNLLFFPCRLIRRSGAEILRTPGKIVGSGAGLVLLSAESIYPKR